MYFLCPEFPRDEQKKEKWKTEATQKKKTIFHENGQAVGLCPAGGPEAFKDLRRRFVHPPSGREQRHG